MARVRRNVAKLPSGDQTLYWYNRAVGAMLQRPITDPTSWRYQAAVHGYPGADNDPLAKPGESYPSTSDQDQFWQQCQHGSWYFLPWHRMYLYLFEQIVAAEVVNQGGPKDWAMPYWNYCDQSDPNARILPAAFQKPSLADGSTNYLYVQDRGSKANEGVETIGSPDVDLTQVFAQHNFSAPPASWGPRPGFGGTELDGAAHFGGYFYAFCVENQPHNHVHNDIGGWMEDPDTAALDPIFWLHHANIDRLWEAWLAADPANQDPTSAEWLSNVTFPLHTPTGEAVTMTCKEVVDISKLGYAYDDVSNPVPEQEAVFGAAPRTEVRMSDSLPPELAGATDHSHQLGDQPVPISVPTDSLAAARSNLTALGGGGAPDAETGAPRPRVLLQLENLTAEAPARSYYVYVNLPAGETPDQHPELRAGRLSLFGIAQASRATDRHSGSGQTYTLDITEIYYRLFKPDDTPGNILVTLVPVHDRPGATVTVGRVSLSLT